MASGAPLTQGTGALRLLVELSQASKGFQDWGINQREAKVPQLIEAGAGKIS